MIHPTAVIETGAELGTGVKVGPFSYIGPHVKLGDGCELRNGVTITGHTATGPDCVFFPGCVIGEEPQDLKYKGGPTQLNIGKDNVFREYVTVHPGTEVAGGVTTIGDHNRFFIGVHIAHDSHLGNHIVIANGVGLAGHVRIEDYVNMGGHAALHHFVTVGRYAMIGGMSRISQDVPPFLITQGYEPRPRGVNLAGLRRWKIDDGDITALTDAYRTLYGKRQADDPFAQRLDRIEKTYADNQVVTSLCAFVRRTLSDGKRGRYLESQRRDHSEDNRAFYALKTVGEQ